MKYKTLRYDMSRPSTRQITEPLNSVYGVAVKVYKDWQPVSADLSVGGVACTDGPGGWKLAELSTGSAPATKELDVEFSAPPTARAELSTDYTYSATKISETSYRASLKAVKNYLSAGTLPVEITVGTGNFDFTAKYRKVKGGEAGEWTSYGAGWRITHTRPEGGTQIITKSGDRWMSYVGGEYVYFDEVTLNTATDYVSFATNITVTDTEAFSAEVVQTISIDTRDGLGGRFKLQVQEDDLGYIDIKEQA